jgi:predicted metalloprotease
MVYVDTAFFSEPSFVPAYLIAHEIGHHVQNMLGTIQQSTPPRRRSRSRNATKCECHSSSKRTAMQASGFISYRSATCSSLAIWTRAWPSH